MDDKFEKWWEEKHKDNRFCDLVDETLKEFFHEAWDAALESQWVSVEDELPGYEEPVIISINGVVQHVTYTRHGISGQDDWFEPFYFDGDDILKIPCKKTLNWMYLPKLLGE